MRTFSELGKFIGKLTEGVRTEFHCGLAALCATSLSWPEAKSLSQLVLGWAPEAGTIPKRTAQEDSWKWSKRGLAYSLFPLESLRRGPRAGAEWGQDPAQFGNLPDF